MQRGKITGKMNFLHIFLQLRDHYSRISRNGISFDCSMGVVGDTLPLWDEALEEEEEAEEEEEVEA